jgi:hypothetical protein
MTGQSTPIYAALQLLFSIVCSVSIFLIIKRFNDSKITTVSFSAFVSAAFFCYAPIFVLSPVSLKPCDLLREPAVFLIYQFFIIFFICVFVTSAVAYFHSDRDG